MNYDAVGQAYCTSDELCDMLYKNPQLDISKFLVSDPASFNAGVKTLYADFGTLTEYVNKYTDADITKFDEDNQANWLMPDEYKSLDIAEYVLGLCKEQYELQRVAQELLLFQERGLLDLLRFMKYLVDTLRKNNIVWGVGRGSSVASYVLYLLGVHRINSLYYQLEIEEFLR